MSKHLQQELKRLKKKILAIGALVEESLQKAVLAFQERNVELAKQVIEEDEKIDEGEVEVEEECLQMLALYQPVAEDLRFITACLKINNDLERMGDNATHIAERTTSLAKDPPVRIPVDLSKMTELALKMVHDTLDAFVRKDTKLAREICVRDDEVDQLHRTILKDLRKRMHDNADEIDQALDIFSATRRIERVADLATNIAQDVVYMVEGEIIRHRRE